MDTATSTALAALTAAARTPPSRHVRDDVHTALLQSIVDTAVSLFAAEAASIALFEPAPDRLEFHVAAGPQGAGVVGLSVAPTRGIAGYVFSTGEPIALSNVTSDPRFDRATAERTGYVPRSIAAVPLSDAGATLGVLQVLDRHGAATFSLADMARLGIFATQATAAIRASRVARDSERLLRLVLAGLPEGEAGSAELLQRIVAGASSSLEIEDHVPFWALVVRLAGLRGLPGAELGLVADVLAALTRERGAPRLQRPRRAGEAAR